MCLWEMACQSHLESWNKYWEWWRTSSHLLLSLISTFSAHVLPIHFVGVRLWDVEQIIETRPYIASRKVARKCSTSVVVSVHKVPTDVCVTVSSAWGNMLWVVHFVNSNILEGFLQLMKSLVLVNRRRIYYENVRLVVLTLFNVVNVFRGFKPSKSMKAVPRVWFLGFVRSHHSANIIKVQFIADTRFIFVNVYRSVIAFRRHNVAIILAFEIKCRCRGVTSEWCWQCVIIKLIEMCHLLRQQIISVVWSCM